MIPSYIEDMSNPNTESSVLSTSDTARAIAAAEGFLGDALP